MHGGRYSQDAVVTHHGRGVRPVLALVMVIAMAMGLVLSVVASTAPDANANFVKNMICSWGYDEKADDASNAFRPAVIYQLTETDDLYKNLYFKSTSGASSDNVEKDWFNMLSGKDYKSPTLDILNTQNATTKKYTPYDLYGFSGMKWSNYSGEWNWIKVYYCGADGHGGADKDPEDQKINMYYEGRNRPLDTWDDIGSSRDPRVRLKSQWFAGVSMNNFNNIIATGLFSITKAVVAFNNMIFTKSMSNIVEDLGLDVLSERIMVNLFNNLFLTLVVMMMGLLGISIAFTALIRKEFRKAMTEVVKAIGIFFAALLIIANPKFFVNLPNYAGMIAQYLTISATTSAFTDSNSVSMCSIATNGSVRGDNDQSPDVFKNGKINKDAITDWLDGLGDSVARQTTCKYWELFALTPWSLGQYGTTVNNLWAQGKVPSATKDNTYHSIGYHAGTNTLGKQSDYPGLAAVPLGNNQVYHNWAIYQLSTQTNAHIPSTIADAKTGKIDEKPDKAYTDLGQIDAKNRKIDSVNGDWWRVVDVVSGYDTKQNASSVGGGSSSSSSDSSGGGNQIDKALDWAQKIAGSSAHGYDQANRNGPDYDCSSLISHALKQAGFNVNVFSTVNEPDELTKAGFKLVDGANFQTGDGLKPGDILLKDGHTEFYTGNGQTVGAHYNESGGIRGGQPGDQTGNEIGPGKLTDNAWTSAYRYGDGASNVSTVYDSESGDTVGAYIPQTDMRVTDWWDTWVGGSNLSRMSIAVMSLFACIALIGPLMLGIPILMASIMSVLLMAFAPVVFLLSIVPNIGNAALKMWGGMLWGTVVKRGLLGVLYMLMMVVTSSIMSNVIGLGNYLTSCMLLILLSFVFIHFKDKLLRMMMNRVGNPGETAVSSKMSRMGHVVGNVSKSAALGGLAEIRKSKVRDEQGEVQREAVTDDSGNVKTNAEGKPVTQAVRRRRVDEGTVIKDKNGEAKLHKHGRKKGQEKKVSRFGSLARSVAAGAREEAVKQIKVEVQQTQAGRLVMANMEHMKARNQQVQNEMNDNGSNVGNEQMRKCGYRDHDPSLPDEFPISQMEQVLELGPDVYFCHDCYDTYMRLEQ